MVRKRLTLTAAHVESLPAIGGDRTEYLDVIVPELALRVSRHGSRTWSVRFWQGRGRGGPRPLPLPPRPPPRRPGPRGYDPPGMVPARAGRDRPRSGLQAGRRGAPVGRPAVGPGRGGPVGLDRQPGLRSPPPGLFLGPPGGAARGLPMRPAGPTVPRALLRSRPLPGRAPAASRGPRPGHGRESAVRRRYTDAPSDRGPAGVRPRCQVGGVRGLGRPQRS